MNTLQGRIVACKENGMLSAYPPAVLASIPTDARYINEEMAYAAKNTQAQAPSAVGGDVM